MKKAFVTVVLLILAVCMLSACNATEKKGEGVMTHTE